MASRNAEHAETEVEVAPVQNEETVQRLQMEILEQSKSLNKSAPVDSLKDSDDSLLKSSQASANESEESSKKAASYDENNQSTNLGNSELIISLPVRIPKVIRRSEMLYYYVYEKPKATELTQQTIQLEREELEPILNQEENIEKRSEIAHLQEKVRRDYEALLKGLQQLSDIEGRAQAKQVPTSSQIPTPTKKCEYLARQLKKMNRAFENILRSSLDSDPCDNRDERPMPITPRDYICSKITPTSA